MMAPEISQSQIVKLGTWLFALFLLINCCLPNEEGKAQQTKTVHSYPNSCKSTKITRKNFSFRQRTFNSVHRGWCVNIDLLKKCALSARIITTAKRHIFGLTSAQLSSRAGHVPTQSLPIMRQTTHICD